MGKELRILYLDILRKETGESLASIHNYSEYNNFVVDLLDRIVQITNKKTLKYIKEEADRIKEQGAH